MEKIGLYSIYDKKGERYDTPFFTSTDLFATRVFMLRMQEEKSFLKQWPEDFILYKIGDFNVIDGIFINDDRVIIEGKQIQSNNGGKNQ